MDTNSKQLAFLLPVLAISIFAAILTFYPKDETGLVETNPSEYEDDKKGAMEVTIDDGTKVLVVVADTDVKRQQGLSGLESLKKNSGMLFVFDKPGKYGFWMKDMNFPIDIIWIDANHTIVHIERNVSPDTFPQLFASSKNALYVLEVAAGFADTHNMEIADQVTF